MFLTADLGTCPALDRRALVSHRRLGHCSLPEERESQLGTVLKVDLI